MSADPERGPQTRSSWVRAQAARTLGISDEHRLDEIEQLAGLLLLISDGMQRLQQTRPEEPSPTPVFRPEHESRDFWEGRPYGA
jgi:hypothetical protein